MVQLVDFGPELLLFSEAPDVFQQVKRNMFEYARAAVLSDDTVEHDGPHVNALV